MDANEYQKACERTMSGIENQKERILCWGLGIAGEAGDVAGCIKKTYVHNNDQSKGIRENIGDTLWYIAAICSFHGWKIGDIMEENIQKLNARYPNGFNFKDAKRERVDWNEHNK